MVKKCFFEIEKRRGDLVIGWHQVLKKGKRRDFKIQFNHSGEILDIVSFAVYCFYELSRSNKHCT